MNAFELFSNYNVHNKDVKYNYTFPIKELYGL